MKYKAFGKFILRTPGKPFTWLLKLLEHGDLTDCCKDEAVMEAIYVASPVLWGELVKLAEGSNGKNRQEEQRLKVSFMKYLTRMATRSTPYGLFSACSIGDIDDKAYNSDIFVNNTVKGFTRLDTSVLCLLASKLMKIPEIRNILTYYPNNTIYRVNKKYRYVEYKYFYGHRAHNISSVERNIYLKRLIRKIKDGARYVEIVGFLENMGIDSTSAKEYTDALIDNTFLVSNIDVTITGEAYLNRLLSVLQAADSEELIPYRKLLEYITNINSTFQKHDSRITQIKYIKELLSTLSFPKELMDVIQVDAFRESNAIKLGKGVADELSAVIDMLCKFTTTMEHPEIAKFRQNFYKRYEEEEVPLLTAIDAEIGLGYPCNNGIYSKHSFIDSFRPASVKSEAKSSGIMDLIREMLLKKMMAYLQNPKKEIVITDEELAGIPHTRGSYPPSIYLFFQLVRDSGNEILINLKHIASSGASFITRFSHIDNKIEMFVKDIAKKEQEIEDKAILAEIVHLSDTRVGNIMTRPHLRNFEIPYLTNSTLPNIHQIPASDILISIKGNRLCLRSKKLGKEIIPCLTNAHNYSNNATPIYRFLCDLQHYGKKSFMNIDWGFLGSYFTFTPRIRYRNTILLPATWYVKTDILKEISKLPDEKMIAETEKWRKGINLPRYALYPAGDNVLFTDFRSTISIKALVSAIKKEEKIHLQEVSYDADSLAVKGCEGGYFNEIIVPYYLNQAESKK